MPKRANLISENGVFSNDENEFVADANEAFEFILGLFLLVLLERFILLSFFYSPK
jgi:hypothetical protein